MKLSHMDGIPVHTHRPFKWTVEKKGSRKIQIKYRSYMYIAHMTILYDLAIFFIVFVFIVDVYLRLNKALAFLFFLKICIGC